MIGGSDNEPPSLTAHNSRRWQDIETPAHAQASFVDDDDEGDHHNGSGTEEGAWRWGRAIVWALLITLLVLAVLTLIFYEHDMYGVMVIGACVTTFIVTTYLSLG